MKDFHDFESPNLRAWADDTGTGLAEREPHRQNGNSTGRTGNRTGRTGIVGRGLYNRPRLRTPANNKSHRWTVSFREHSIQIKVSKVCKKEEERRGEGHQRLLRRLSFQGTLLTRRSCKAIKMKRESQKRCQQSVTAFDSRGIMLPNK